MNVELLLDQLADFQDQRDYLALKRQELIDAAYPAEVKARIVEINAEFDGKEASVNENITALTEQVKAAVITGGASIKGARLHAVYAKGRVSWDSKKLDGMMIVIPALAEARKEGEPSVSIRKI